MSRFICNELLQDENNGDTKVSNEQKIREGRASSQQSSNSTEETTTKISKSKTMQNPERVHPYLDNLKSSIDMGESFPYLSVDAVFNDVDYWATLKPKLEPSSLEVKNFSNSQRNKIKITSIN